MAGKPQLKAGESYQDGRGWAVLGSLAKLELVQDAPGLWVAEGAQRQDLGR